MNSTVFEIVEERTSSDQIEYEEELPLHLIPFHIRNDEYNSIGTAFAVGPHLYMTAAHVLSLEGSTQQENLFIRDTSGTVYKIDRIYKYDTHRDFALFSVEGRESESWLKMEDNIGMNIPVFAIGNAHGEGVIIREGLLTSRTPESLNGEWKWLRYSAAASPGNSGGPLTDKEGNVIGIVTAKSENENLNYALPLSETGSDDSYRALYRLDYNYMIPVSQARYREERIFETALPKPIGELRDELVRIRRETTLNSVEELLGENKDEWFPFDPEGQKELLQKTYTGLFPVVVTEKEDSTWNLIQPKEIENAGLAERGEIKYGKIWGDTFFELKDLKTETVADLIHNPKRMMDKILSGYLLTRKIGSESIRITSLGDASESSTKKDNWGRKWMTASYPIPFADMEILLYAVPTPNGIVGLFALIPTSATFPYRLDFNEMINNITFSYEASLEEWESFLSTEEILPDFLISSTFQFEPGKDFRWINDRISLQFDSSLLGITPQSRLHINPYFIQSKEEIIWNVNNIYFYENESKRSYISLERVFPPLSPMDTKVHEKWDSLHSAKYPYTGDLIISKEKSYMFENMIPPGSSNNKEELNFSWSVGLCIDNELDSREMNGRFRLLMNGFTLLSAESEAASYGFENYIPQDLSIIEDSTIFQAVSNNNIELVNRFISGEIDLNKTNYEGRTPFMLAARLEKVEIARLLMGNKIDLAAIDNYGHTSLLLALRYLPEDICLAIIRKGIHLDTVDQEGFSPLMVAAKQKSNSAAQLLLNMGVDLSLKNISGKDALYYSCCYGMDELSERLIKNGAPMDGAHSNGYNTLMAAFENSSTHIVDLLIDNGASLNEVTDSGWSTLHGALRFGHKDAARKIFHQSTYLNSKSSDKWTPLHLAIRYGNQEIALALIENEVDLNAANDNQWTPLHFALRYDQPEVAKEIIDRGGEINLRTNTDWTPLHFASRNNQPFNARLLIEKGALINAQTEDGYTALHLSLRNEQPQTASFLIEQGADINIQNSIGWSAIHYALRYSTSFISKELIDKGCDLSAKTNNNWTPLLFAIRYQDAAMARYIIEKGGDITTTNKDQTNALMLAARFNPTVLLDLIDSPFPINAQNIDGDTALHYAIEGENKGAFFALLQKGADPLLRNKDGKSAKDLLDEAGLEDWL